MKADRAALDLHQLPEERILALARNRQGDPASRRP